MILSPSLTLRDAIAQRDDLARGSLPGMNGGFRRNCICRQHQDIDILHAAGGDTHLHSPKTGPRRSGMSRNASTSGPPNGLATTIAFISAPIAIVEYEEPRPAVAPSFGRCIATPWIWVRKPRPSIAR